VAFTVKDWRDAPDTSTPLSAAALEDMETRLSSWTSVSDNSLSVQVFGARGDGTTDDAAAIQAAINAAASVVDDVTYAGVDVYIPAGTYNIGSTLVLKHGVTLRGAGKKSTILRRTSNIILLDISGTADTATTVIQNVHIRDLELNSTSRAIGTWTAPLVRCYYTQWVHWTNVNFRRAGGRAIAAVRYYDGQFLNCRWDYCGATGHAAVHLQNSEQGKTVGQFGYSIDSCNNLYFVSCTWESNPGTDLYCDGRQSDGTINTNRRQNMVRLVGSKMESGQTTERTDDARLVLQGTSHFELIGVVVSAKGTISGNPTDWIVLKDTYNLRATHLTLVATEASPTQQAMRTGLSLQGNNDGIDIDVVCGTVQPVNRPTVALIEYTGTNTGVRVGHAYYDNNPSGAGLYSGWPTTTPVQTLNVREFGAKGDGVTDDTVAINQAITSAANLNFGNGGEVIIPAGTYKFTTLLYRRDVKIRGAGINSTTLDQISGTTDVLARSADTTVSHRRIEWEDFTLTSFNNQTANTGGVDLFRVFQSHFRRVKISFHNNFAWRVKGGPTDTSGDSMRNEFHDCEQVARSTGSTYAFQLSTGGDQSGAVNGGAHPDGTRIIGGITQSNYSAVYRIDPPYIDSALAYAADKLQVIGHQSQGVSRVMDIQGGWGHTFVGCRWENTGGTMSVDIGEGTTNKPVENVSVIGCSYYAAGSAPTINNNTRKALYHVLTEVDGFKMRVDLPVVTLEDTYTATQARNNSIFRDAADGLLKWKTDTGFVVPISLSSVIDVRRFGAKGDGTTDDAAAIQAAIDSATATGADVQIPAGTFIIGTTLSLPGGVSGKGGILRGAGSQASVLKLKNGANTDLLATAGTYWTIRNLGLDGNKANNTLGNCLKVAFPRVWVQDLYIANAAENGILNLGTVSQSAHAGFYQDLYIISCGGIGFYVKDQYSADVQALGIWVGQSGSHGIKVESVSSLWTNIHSWGNGGDGFASDGAGGHTTITTIYSETNTGSGIRFSTGSSGNKVTNFWIWKNTIHGIFLENIAGKARVNISDGEFQDMVGYGIVGQNTSYVTVHDIHSHDEQATKTQGYAIQTNGTSDRWMIKNCIILAADHRLTSKSLVGNNNIFKGNIETVDAWRRAVTATGSIFSVDPPLIAVTTLATPITLTLPGITVVPAGTEYRIKDEVGTAGTNNITVACAGADTVDGVASKVINTNYGQVRVYSTGSAWFTK
jgi:polygalacturonase